MNNTKKELTERNLKSVYSLMRCSFSGCNEKERKSVTSRRRKDRKISLSKVHGEVLRIISLL